MNVLLINDSSSNPNWGDRAAAIALKQMIVGVGGTISGVLTEDELREGTFFRDPEDRPPTAVGGHRIKDRVKLFVPPIVLKLRDKLLKRLRIGEDDIGPIPPTLNAFDRHVDLFLWDRTRFGGLLDAIAQAEVVVIHGDGCMVDNGMLPRAELFLSYLIKQRFGLPIIIVNHTADFNHPELGRMAQAVYPLFDDVVYRDQISAERCRGRWQGRYVADSAFLFEPAPRENWAALAGRPTFFDVWPDQARFDPSQPYICVGGSSIYPFALPPEGQGPPEEVIDAFTALVQHLGGVYSGQIVLTASDLKDEAIFRPIARRLNFPLVGLTTPVQQAVDIVGNAEAYVGGRWHTGIFSLRGGTPVVPLSSKTFKMRALIEMAGLPVATFDAHDLHEEKEGIGRALDALLGQGEVLRRRLRLWAQQQAAEAWGNVAFLRQWQLRSAAEQRDMSRTSSA